MLWDTHPAWTCRDTDEKSMISLENHLHLLDEAIFADGLWRFWPVPSYMTCESTKPFSIYNFVSIVWYCVCSCTGSFFHGTWQIVIVFILNRAYQDTARTGLKVESWTKPDLLIISTAFVAIMSTMIKYYSYCRGFFCFWLAREKRQLNCIRIDISSRLRLKPSDRCLYKFSLDKNRACSSQCHIC